MFARLKNICFMLLLAAALGCQQTPAPAPDTTPGTAPPTGPMVYEGQPLGSAVNELKGISLVAVADSLTEQLSKAGAPEGVYFIMLSQKIPDQGIIVKAPEGYTIEDVKAQSSGQIELTGTVKSLKDEGLSEFAKERYEMTLATGDQGVLWVDNTGKLPWKRAGDPEAEETPETDGTPGASTPEAKEADGEK